MKDSSKKYVKIIMKFDFQCIQVRNSTKKNVSVYILPGSYYSKKHNTDYWKRVVYYSGEQGT